MNLRRQIFALLLIAVPAAWGWSSQGHRDVGAVADALISGTPADSHVKAILGPGSTLSDASIWADCAKSIHPEKNFQYIKDNYYDSHCQIFDASPAGIGEMEAYVRRNNDNCSYAGKPQNCHKSFHFADIPIQEGHYDEHFVGAEPYDVVHAINAAIARLKHKPVPEPFKFADGAQGEREALRALAHFVGHIHQPLHVGSIYLSPGGRGFKPDPNHFDPGSNTIGGNALIVGSGHAELHGEWDHVPKLDMPSLLNSAKTIPKTKGPIEGWSSSWATDSVLQAQIAFETVRFGPRAGKEWPAEFPDRQAYIHMRNAMQGRQVTKAGKHLSDLLKAIWPQ